MAKLADAGGLNPPSTHVECGFKSRPGHTTRWTFAESTGRLDVTQGAISELEHSDDVRASTLRQYLEGLGARLELVAVFDDDDRRVPVHLGRDSDA